ncbi:Uncharacterised protein [Burkholderia pseudomallei]|nr:Uncharacterised protein [Burkholderia pseudomallei]CAK0043139.1 Uncharacterised protein [Burkholderia pseudomallei]CAK0073280.1 Uncharacterised protein [Burkholderia pseudomallei]CFL71908.1 Uncharacterised protein [Burkholderia pseudomallei]CFV97730.1 Uncharacterised protein [Burkholderia pseudomallei]
MSRPGKDIKRSVHIAIMTSITFTAYPMPYSKICDTFRPLRRHCATRRTDLGRETFVNFLVLRAMPNGLVREHCSEGRPARIVDRLRHAGLGESSRIHVPYGDVIEFPHNAMRELVEKIRTRTRNARVDIRRLALLLGTLGLGETFLKSTEIARVVDLLAGRECSEILEAQINADAIEDLATRRICNFNANIEKPIPASVSRKVSSILDLPLGKRAAVENAKRVPRKAKRVSLSLKISPLDRNPTEGFPASVAKVWSPALIARFEISVTNLTDSARMNTKFLAASGSELFKIKRRRPFLAPFKRMLLRVVTEIPNVVHRAGLLIQQPI